MVDNFTHTSEPSMASLVGGIVNDAQSLIKNELELAKVEIAQELTKAKEAAISLSVGIGVCIVGGLVLVFTLIHFMHWASSGQLPLWACHGIVGGVLSAIGVGLFLVGKKKADEVHVLPEQSIATLKDNVAWIKSKT